jgi:hypothetical protein
MPNNPAAIAALRLDVEGQVSDVTVNTGADGLHLKSLYRLINCRLVDVVRLTTQLDMWVDDEGAYTQPINLAAIVVARGFGFTWQPYWGTVVLTGGAGSDGETLPLGAPVRQAALDLAERARGLIALRAAVL